ncbi:transposase [Microcoleus sp. N3A4]|uniref:transposase n=1 Tax=Microcoleus sp. N3A4 TaxID=3055379 RepID=UPI002FD5D978
MTSIPGIGEQTAGVLLAEIGRISDYNNARQLAAHEGLTPCERSSGTEVKGILYRKCQTKKGIVFACGGGNAS